MHAPRAAKIGIGALLRLGWRNLARNRKRTWITATTVAFAIFLFQLMAALMIGLERQSFDNLIDFQTAHAKLYATGYYDNRDELPLDVALTDLEQLRSTIESVDGVAASTPRVVFSAQLSNGIDQIACMGTGIQVEGSDDDVFRLPQAIVEGSYLQPGEEGMLIGHGLAKFLDVETGDWLTVLTKTRQGAYEAIDLPVVGKLGTGNPLIDQNSIMLPLETARYVLDMQDAATELAVRFSPAARESTTLQRIRDRLAATSEAEIKGWREVEADFMTLVETKRTSSSILMGIFTIMAVVGITNTMLMAAFERTREIGTLMAMGLRGSGIRRLFLVEGGLTGLLGGAMGSLLAAGIIAYLAVNGIDFTALYGDMDIGYPVQGIVYPSSDPIQIVGGWLATAVLGALASYYPAARASRLNPVQALRYV